MRRMTVNKSRSASKFRRNVGRMKAANVQIARGGFRL